MSGVVTIGLDFAKSIFQIHGVDGAGRMMLRRRLSRHELVPYFAKLSPCLIGMEACSAALVLIKVQIQVLERAKADK
jgi:transposase